MKKTQILDLEFPWLKSLYIYFNDENFYLKGTVDII